VADTPDDALIEAIARAIEAAPDPPPGTPLYDWRGWTNEAHAAYAALVEHLGLTEETRRLPNGWGGSLTDSDGTTKTYGRAATVERRLVSQWVKVQP
jgi:hypothetical protein